MSEPKSDRLIFSPHEHFLTVTKPEDRAALRSTAGSALVESALLHAYAYMAAGGASREELNGAIKFIGVFQNISEPAPKQQTLPVRSLQAL